MKLLDRIDMLGDLTAEDKANLELFCQEKFIEKGEILFKEGDEANAMYILASGSIEISKNTVDGKILLGQVHAEEILGEMALFNTTGKRMATATTLEDSVLLTILSFSIKELTEKNPDLLDKIKTIIEERMISNKIIESKVGE